MYRKKLTEHLRSYSRSSGYARWMRRAADEIDLLANRLSNLWYTIYFLCCLILILSLLLFSTRINSQPLKIICCPLTGIAAEGIEIIYRDGNIFSNSFEEAGS